MRKQESNISYKVLSWIMEYKIEDHDYASQQIMEYKLDGHD